MSDKLIGIDGGGTKTLGVVYNLDGTEQTRIEKGFANFSVDVSKTKQHIESCIDALMATLNATDTVRHIQLGIAGLSALNDPNAYAQMLSHRYNTSVDLVTDAVLALHSIQRDVDQGVIMIVSGTGSVVMADEAGETTVIGGYGHLLGEEGSGYHLAIQALKQLIAEQENGQPTSSLSKRLADHLALNRREDLIQFIYRGKKQDIARLALIIAKEAKAGDLKARQLFEEEGRYLGKQTWNAYKKLQTKQPPIIALRGTFLMQAPFVKHTLMEFLQTHIKQFIVDDEPVEPVIGAYYLGQSKLAKR